MAVMCAMQATTGGHDTDPVHVFAYHAGTELMADQFDLPKYGGYEAVRRIPNADTRNRTLHAMKDESDNMWRKGLFEHIDEDSIESSDEICTLTWSLRAKPTKYGTLDKVKARLCIRGDLMKKGVHFTDSYSPVMSMAAFRAMLTYAAAYGWLSLHIDFVAAYLNAVCRERIFVRAPKGLSGAVPGEILRLRKWLYGAPPSGREWHLTVMPALQHLGFSQSDADPCLLLKGMGTEEEAMCGLVVDDCAFVAKNQATLDALAKYLGDKFEIDVRGQLDWFYGIGITWDRSTQSVLLSQQTYVETLLRRFDLEGLRPLSTPITTVLRKRREGEPACTGPYRQLIGGLLFTLLTRADLPFAVGHLCRFMANPSALHWEAGLRVLRYLMHTPDRKLRLGALSKITCVYADADFAGEPDEAKSTGGVLTLLLGSSIDFSSRLQKGTGISSCESEYMNLTPAVQQGLWLRKLVANLELEQQGAIIVQEDNKSAIALANDSGRFRKRTKHINVKYHFMRQHIDSGEISLQFCPTKDMLADIYTKPLQGLPFARLRDAVLQDLI